MTILSAISIFRDAYRYGDQTGWQFQKFMVDHGDAAALCSEFDDGGCPTPAGIVAAEGLIEIAKNWTPTAWKIYATIDLFRDAARAAWCEVTDHDWVDESYGGPESGCMAARCKRCSHSFLHTLY